MKLKICPICHGYGWAHTKTCPNRLKKKDLLTCYYCGKKLKKISKYEYQCDCPEGKKLIIGVG